jgi:lysophospholipase L1-like esterase
MNEKNRQDRQETLGAVRQPPLNLPGSRQLMIKIKNILKNLGVLLGGCLVALLLLEVLLRIHNPLEIRFKPNRIVLPVNKHYIINNVGKFTKLPPVTIHTKNCLGFRGAPPPRNFSDYLTIVTVGGSTTECFYLSDGHTWTALLGRELSQDFNRLWINNAGLDGATTYRHLILMEDYIDKLRPKVVLFLFGINDVGEGDIAAEEAEKQEGHYLRNLWRAVLYRSEVYCLEQNLYHYLIAQRRGLRHRQINLRKVRTLDRIPEATAQKTLQYYRTKSLPFYVARVEKLIKVSRDHGIEPVFITQPTLYGPGLDPVTGVNLATVRLRSHVNGGLMFKIVNLYNDVTRQEAQKHRALLIDLAREMPHNSAYYYDYLHYTDPGAAEVAAIIDRHLAPWLARHYPSFRKGPAS